jgi:hypothetical protein
MLPLYFNIHQYENKIGYYKHIYFISYFMFISSSLWYIEDFSITGERKITNITQRKNTKQTIGSYIAWISTGYSYISLLFENFLFFLVPCLL